MEKLTADVSFAEAAVLWLAEQEKMLRPATYVSYQRCVNRHILPHLGDRKAKDVTRRTAEELVNSLAAGTGEAGRTGKGLRGNSLAFVRDITLRIAAFAKRKDAPEAPETRADEKRPYTCLAPQEIERLCFFAKHHPSREMLGIMLMLFTGIRLGEACALSCDDISLTRREIHIHRSVQRVRSDGGPGQGKTTLEVYELPTKSQIRTETIPAELVPYVKRYYAPGLFLIAGKRNAPLDPRTFQYRAARLFEENQMPVLTFQRLRKTYVEGRADRSILAATFGAKKPPTPYSSVLDHQWLAEEMRSDLKPLRLLVGLTPEEMGDYMGVSECSYRDIEDGKRALGWNEYIALLFFFHYNAKTKGVVDSLGLYPAALQEKMEIA